jgi:hypothetical protein
MHYQPVTSQPISRTTQFELEVTIGHAGGGYDYHNQNKWYYFVGSNNVRFYAYWGGAMSFVFRFGGWLLQASNILVAENSAWVAATATFKFVYDGTGPFDTGGASHFTVYKNGVVITPSWADYGIDDPTAPPGTALALSLGCEGNGANEVEPPGNITYFRLSLPPSPPPPSPPSSPDRANGQADPHIHFAHGGEADFRGVNGTHYVLLSSPNLSFTGRTIDAAFVMHGLSVEGSFFSEVAWTVSTSNGTYFVYYRAKRPWCMYLCPTLTPLESQQRPDVLVTSDNGFRLGIGQRTVWKLSGGDLTIQMKDHTLVVTSRGWEVKATRKPVYGWRRGPSWRIDFAIVPVTRVPQSKWACYPHGLVGQSFDGDKLKADGKKDDYNKTGSITTTSMAEGAIEGNATDYAVHGAFDTTFPYSRYHKTRCPPRSLRGLNTSLKADSEGVFTTLI